MRSTLVLLAAGVAALALAGCQKKQAAAPSQGQAAASAAAPSASLSLTAPHRKPGLWEMHQSVSGIDRVITSTLCIDEATEKKMSVWSTGADQKVCSTGAITRLPDGSLRVTSTCNMGSAGTSVSTATVSGDFNDRYRVHVDSTVTGAAVPQMNGQHTMIVDAQWKGACPAGQVGGDMTMPGVGKINISAGK
jgi:hypothetical protein